jgi:hypothetical protein
VTVALRVHKMHIFKLMEGDGRLLETEKERKKDALMPFKTDI